MLVEGAFVAGVVLAAGWDLWRRRVPNGVSVTLLALGLVIRLGLLGVPSVAQGLLGALVALAVFIVPFALRKVGGGDVKLAMALGAWLGPWGALVAAVVGVARGGVVSMAVLAIGGAALRRQVAANLFGWAVAKIPLAPAPRPLSQTVPFAVALGAAAIGVFIHQGGIGA